MPDDTDRPDAPDATHPTNAHRPTAPSSSAFDKTTETEALPPSPLPGPSASRASVPPSEPRGASRGSFSQLDLSADRPARLQMIVALVLGLVLVAIPLYLWRRPRAESIAATGSANAGIDPNAAAAEATTSPPPDDGKPTIGEPKSILCQDPGPKKTAPEQCDHLADVEKAFAKAIEETSGCVPKDAGGGTIQFVADVSFKRRAVTVATPKEGRTMKNGKIVSACQSAVKSKLQALSLEAIQHAHARYKIAITVGYPGSVK
ncbi:MAG: hypothetical protein NVS3B10_24480 [Polyangiales bacterium]